jgi:hypothetical protein
VQLVINQGQDIITVLVACDTQQQFLELGQYLLYL